MNSFKCALKDAPRIIKGRKWLVEPAGIYTKGYCVKTGFRSLFIFTSSSDIEGILLVQSLLVFGFLMLLNNLLKYQDPERASVA